MRRGPRRARRAGRDARLHARAAAGRALDDERAADRGQAVLQAAQPAARVHVDAADPVVLDAHDDGRARGAATIDARAVARAYFATFVSPSATTKYAAASTGRGEALGDGDVGVDGHGRALGQRLDRRAPGRGR